MNSLIDSINSFANLFGRTESLETAPTPALIVMATITVAWILYWKGRGLWAASKNDDKWWFIAMLLINILGVLEILYIYVFSKKRK